MYLHDAPLARNTTPIHPKFLTKGVDGVWRVFADRKAKPFARLGGEDLLNTDDVCRLLDCSQRTVYRWVSEGTLRPDGKVGREFLYKKADLLRWYEERPTFGRPLGS